MDHCASCEEPIDWVLTTNGKWMPLDIGRQLGGSIVIGVRDGLARYCRPDPELLAHVSHMDTCPHAHAYRRETA